ncbi:glycoside hydrolase family protein [Endozoicomonas sp. SM1973]|uniref:Lysozyme n=1 Tax=Spartinivicinus marinus TaxID=2994442 RepID=A0A853I9E0_9GAMM|nr:glycoside hydrolase family protein [Spartinivicinus marinus]NYZ69499.1 glycoside hydrolase family protein [Spartinivicinus marinus]
MSSIIALIEFEEGWCPEPYLCSEGYPTIGYGFKIGPKGASISQYQFEISQSVGKQWLNEILTELQEKAFSHSEIRAAVAACNDARKAVLISMAYQMGVSGLLQFKKALKAIADQRWSDAKTEMLDSRWVRQTQKRAVRHANQILSGEWFGGY